MHIKVFKTLYTFESLIEIKACIYNFNVFSFANLHKMSEIDYHQEFFLLFSKE